MKSTMGEIREKYHQMGRAEQKIADFAAENLQDFVQLSISELAKRCGCGNATVVRFARRLGFSGYQTMRIQLAREFSHSSTVSETITREDSCFTVFQKRIADVAVSLRSTEAVLDPQALERATAAIADAKRIVIFGLGNSAAIAADAAHKFLRLGLNAQSCSDNHMQAIIAAHLDKHCVAIGITHSGMSRDIVEALKSASQRGAVTIAVTNLGNSPVVDVADLTLFTRSEETEHSILAMNSRIAQLVIFDAIYSTIVVRQSRSTANAIYRTETALLNKKFE